MSKISLGLDAERMSLFIIVSCAEPNKTRMVAMFSDLVEAEETLKDLQADNPKIVFWLSPLRIRIDKNGNVQAIVEQ